MNLNMIKELAKLDKLAELKLTCKSSYSPANDEVIILSKLNGVFQQLKYLRSVHVSPANNEILVDLDRNNPGLKKLILANDNDAPFTDDSVAILVDSCPDLEEIRIRFHGSAFGKLSSCRTICDSRAIEL